MEFNSSQESILVKINGSEYNIRKPKMKDILFLNQKNAEMEGKSDYEKTVFLIEFLDSLGFPKDVSMDLEADIFLKIVEAITNLNKKK
jgi:hypothetical protein